MVERRINEKIDRSKSQYKKTCIQSLKSSIFRESKSKCRIYNYLKTFKLFPSRTMYGQFKRIYKWTRRQFQRYCERFAYVFEFDQNNKIHIHGAFLPKSSSAKRWFLEKSGVAGFCWINEVDNYDNHWDYLIKDIDFLKEVIQSRNSTFKLCLHNMIFHSGNNDGWISDLL